MRLLNLMHDNLIRAQMSDGETRLSLPAVFAGLMANRIDSFAALRAHQRHAWHAFLCQLGAMALHKAGLTSLPMDEAAWREIILALTPGADAETAWCLIAPPDRPAFLQPPIPDGLAALKKTIATPDGIDMLVTSRNHDLKQASMWQAEPDDWLFALLTLQTMEGFLGAGNYGISRMNGGFASRPAVGLAPAGGPGLHVSRDIVLLLALRSKIVSSGQNASAGGISLVWLRPWDGTDAIKPASLDPFYIEIARRIRLMADGGLISARAGSSKCARVQPTPGGITGDPWAPLKQDKDGSQKVFTLDSGGFSYRRMVDLMFGDDFTPSPLQELAETDPAEGLVLIARGLVRGQGKTEGYHERIVPLSRRLRGLRATPTDPVSHMAKERVQMAGEVQRRVLKPALLSLFQNGPEQIDYGHDATARKAQSFLEDFDHIVDQDFFSALWEEAEAGTAEEQIAARTAWLQTLLKQGDKILRRADTAAPKSSHRHFRALSHALDVLRNAPWRSETLKGWMPETPKPEAEHAA
jgi:CRISPR system Cascade subunit CasA